MKIFSEKVIVKGESKIRSMDNLNHTPRGNLQIGSLISRVGGDVKIFNEKIQFNSASKIGSKDNLKHTPQGLFI